MSSTDDICKEGFQEFLKALSLQIGEVPEDVQPFYYCIFSNGFALGTSVAEIARDLADSLPEEKPLIIAEQSSLTDGTGFQQLT